MVALSRNGGSFNQNLPGKESVLFVRKRTYANVGHFQHVMIYVTRMFCKDIKKTTHKKRVGVRGWE